MTFTGRAWSEHKLLRLAYAFEQASDMRKPPPGLPALQTSDACRQMPGEVLQWPLVGHEPDMPRCPTESAFGVRAEVGFRGSQVR